MSDDVASPPEVAEVAEVVEPQVEPEGPASSPDPRDVLTAALAEFKPLRRSRCRRLPDRRAGTVRSGALEAMSARRPIVASHCGGIPETVVEGATGYLVPPDDAEALAAAVRRVLLEPDTARAMGERGRTDTMLASYTASAPTPLRT